jgi:hypothetical protein
MISEVRFTRSYNSLWRSLAPTMELFVRKANLRLYSRNWIQLEGKSKPEDRALVNQIAFQSLKDAVLAHDQYQERIRFLSATPNLAAAEEALTRHRSLGQAELEEASALAVRMCYHLYYLRKDSVTLNPRFEGCGIVNACFGDVLTEAGEIIELKDGDRPFRSYEFRQLTIYAALRLNSTGTIPKSVSVINSRRGVSVELSIDSFAEEVAGQSGYDYLREVTRVISDITIY